MPPLALVQQNEDQSLPYRTLYKRITDCDHQSLVNVVVMTKKLHIEEGQWNKRAYKMNIRRMNIMTINFDFLSA